MPQVSIIVLTYYPDREKLLRTLCAAAGQKDLDFEIILSDDGTKDADFSWLPDFFASQGIRDYQIIANPENGGTVKNCLGAVRKARGKYVFLTSPGDFLYDDHVLSDFYRFAEAHNCPLCFGNAVFYTAEGTPRLTRETGSPLCPHLYRPGAGFKQSKAAFFGGNWVIGAAYFRQRDLALTYLETLADTAIYMEDTTSTAFALADGHRLVYFDRNLVWYEDGSGVSTGVSEKWRIRLQNDLTCSFTKLKALHPNDPYTDIALCNVTVTDPKKRILTKLLRHPFAMLRILACKAACRPKPIRCCDADLARLTALLRQTF